MNRNELLDAVQRRASGDNREDKRRVRALIAGDVAAYLARGGAVRQITQADMAQVYCVAAPGTGGRTTRRYGQAPAAVGDIERARARLRAQRGRRHEIVLPGSADGPMPRRQA